MVDSKPVATPMEEAKSMEDRSEFNLNYGTTNDPAVDAPYREGIGSLMYLMTGTRPDITYTVSKVAQFCENPQ